MMWSFDRKPTPRTEIATLAPCFGLTVMLG
jgi:hypothetical protein